MGLFGNRVFAVCASVGLIVGFALFGSVTYLPLYLQVVQGSSPTVSGLELLPLMGGMFVTSIASGQAISRTGRYRIFPIVGTATAVAGLLLLSRLDVTSSRLMIAASMAVLGLGLGLVMQVLVLAAQNAVEYEHLGVATSGITLFRSIGGSVGTAVLGAVFASSLAGNLSRHGGAFADSSSHDRIGLDTLSQMTSADRLVYLQSFTDALGTLFTVAAAIAGVGFLIALALEERPLRETVAASAGPGEAFAPPTDSDSIAQISHGLWALLNRVGKKRLLERVASRAGVNLPPASIWLLSRIDRDGRLSVDELATAKDLDIELLRESRAELIDRKFVHVLSFDDAVPELVLTPEGRETLDALFTARHDLLADMVRAWHPDEHKELDDLLEKLADEIESEVPAV
jgi:hypothetical protein